MPKYVPGPQKGFSERTFQHALSLGLEDGDEGRVKVEALQLRD